MADTEISTAFWSGFYDNDPWLNQANWQKYFSPVFKAGTIPSEIITGQWRNGLSPFVNSLGNLYLDRGVVYKDGISAEFDWVQIAADTNKFYLVRIDTTNKNAKLIGKDINLNSMDASTLAATVAAFLANPTYMCDTTYDVPIALVKDSEHILDLRRFVTDKTERWNKGNLNIEFPATDSPTVLSSYFEGAYGYSGSYTAFVRAYGGFDYNINFAAGCGVGAFLVMPVPLCSAEPMTFKIKNDTASNINVYLAANSYNMMVNSYNWVSSWTASGVGYNKSLAAGAEMSFILTPMGIKGDTANFAVSSPSTSEGGEIDPEEIYTKSEVNTLLGAKANTSDVYPKADVYTKAQTDGLLADKANADDVYTKSQVYTKTAIDNNFCAKADTYSKTDSYSKSEVNTLLHQYGAAGPNKFYVDGSAGSDSNNGTSASYPFRTIQKAIDSASPAGMTEIEVLTSGEYNENLSVDGKTIRLYSSQSIEIRIRPDSGKALALSNGAFVQITSSHFTLYTKGSVALDVSKNSTIILEKLETNTKHDVSGGHYTHVQITGGSKMIVNNELIMTSSYWEESLMHAIWINNSEIYAKKITFVKAIEHYQLTFNADYALLIVGTINETGGSYTACLKTF